VRASLASEPRERREPAPFDYAQGVVSAVEPRSGERESVYKGSPRGEPLG